ncbi:hypothetical protein Patl1_15068 [Pistacia atlantica]|uniref:Uncharacterized protein n=1 Tax=Pistacia atlantica TaxID=434234 RepID=A0ACC1B9B8_9ROSI|nr:hypothetical protein Patl1_15068 [Pistacia atlantica]
MGRVSCVVFFVISHLLLLCSTEEEKRFNPKCPPFSCGFLGNFGLPFSNKTHPECGLCIVDGCDKPLQKIKLGKHVPWFDVLGIFEDTTVMLHDPEFRSHPDNRSCISLKNLSLPISPFLSFEMSNVQTVFKCPLNYRFPPHFGWNCNKFGHSFLVRYSNVKLPNNSLPQCSRIPFLVNKTQHSVEFFNLYTYSFSLEVNVRKECYDCDFSEGQCETDSQGKFHCSVTERTGITNYGRKYWDWFLVTFCPTFHFLQTVLIPGLV